MPRSRSLTVALVGGLALLGAACGGSATAKSIDATAAASAKTAAATASTAAGDGSPSSSVPTDPGSMPDGGGGPGRGGPGGFGDLAAAATAIGVNEADLRIAVDGGQTIAQVAATKGVSVDTVVAAMVAAMKAHFEPEVASGEHTQAEVDRIMANATEQMTAIINGQQPAGGPGGRGPGDGDHGGEGGDDAGTSSGNGRKADTGTSSTTVAA